MNIVTVAMLVGAAYSIPMNTFSSTSSFNYDSTNPNGNQFSSSFNGGNVMMQCRMVNGQKLCTVVKNGQTFNNIPEAQALAMTADARANAQAQQAQLQQNLNNVFSSMPPMPAMPPFPPI